VYGSIHGCVDFLLVARVIFRVFFELFSLDFRVHLVPSIMRYLDSDLLVGIMDRCLGHLCA
jgi:thiosulfate reductase cytochrome b subunit